jgi:peptidoglycan/LPS O-acetylase OafA/YrhL
VIFGEASYSLYLLHYYTMHEVALHFAWNRSAPVRLAIFFIGVAFSLTVSRAVYVMFERPAQRWLRANFKPLKLHISLGAVFLVTTFFCIMASKQIHAAGHLIFEP